MADIDDRIASNLPGQPRKFVERRKKQDWVVRAVTVIAAFGWLCAIVALLLIERASPAQENFITRYLNAPVVSFWNTTLLRWAFVATLASFLVSVIGFVFNVSRHRRKTDRFNKLLIAIGISSTVIFAVYLISFYEFL